MINSVLQKRVDHSVPFRFRLLVYVLFISCISGFLSAQQVNNNSTDFKGEWFIGFGAGPRIYFADHARQLNLSDRISGGADLYVGKWMSPLIAIRAGGSFQTLKGATQQSSGSHGIDTDKPYYIPEHWLWRQKFDAWHLYGDMLFNASNLFAGINEDRFWTLTPFVGLGYMSTWDQPKAQEISLNIGLMNSLRLSSSVDLNIDIRGAMVKERFHGNDVGSRPNDGVLSVNLGVTYRFGGSGKSKPVYVHYEPYFPDPPSLHEPVIERVVEKITEWKDVASDVLILFQIGQSTLSRDARVQIGFLARLMHEYPESQYIISGYADEGTGNPDLNDRLSSARAERVKDCLIGEFGISPTRLKTVAVGGIENRYYNDPSLSRSVIISPDKS